MSPIAHDNTGRGLGRVPYPSPFWARLLSLTLALVLSGLVLVYPGVIAETAASLRHGALSLLFWGVATGFVHGVGFVPRMNLWRAVFHPLLGWALMAGGVAWLTFA